MQFGPQAVSTSRLAAGSEMQEFASWAALPDTVTAYTGETLDVIDPEGRAIAASFTPEWPNSNVYFGTVYGVGDDNPADPYDLTALQQRRALVAMLEQTSFFQVRFALSICCTTCAARRSKPSLPAATPAATVVRLAEALATRLHGCCAEDAIS